MSGPSLQVSSRQALALSLALNELATNASKYGALSGDRGRVSIRWQLDGCAGAPRLTFRWSEAGGPAVPPAPGSGFGTTLIRQSLAGEFGGEVRLEFPATGVTCTLICPLPGAAETAVPPASPALGSVGE
jgi:two-component sensor histidine kinase